MTALPLAELDDAPPRDIDPRVLAGNLAALRRVNEPLARAIESTSVPSHWRAVHGLDGSPAWRVEEGTPAAWLAGTAAPACRAGGLLASLAVLDRNPILTRLAAGAEAIALLGRRQAHQTIFVIEPDPATLRAFLSTFDVSDSIERRALVILSSSDLAAEIRQLLAHEQGLAAPATIVVNPCGRDVPLGPIQAACESATKAVQEIRDRRLHALICDARPVAPSRRVAVLALSADPRDHRLARVLANSAAAAGLECALCAADHPSRATLLPAAEILARHAPRSTICVATAAGPLAPLAGRALHWVIRPPAGSDSAFADAACLAAGEDIAESLTSLKGRPASVARFPWGCPDGLPPAEPAPAGGRVVALLGDLPAVDPELCGIEQPTHVLLWNAARERLPAAAGSSTAVSPTELLAVAERQCGLTVTDDSVRAMLLRGLREILIPAVIGQWLATQLRSEGWTVRGIGRGWERLLPADAVVPDLLSGWDAGPAPLAAISAGAIEPWQRDVPIAAALGWRLLVHSPGSGSRGASLRKHLSGPAQATGFSDARELSRLIRRLADSPAEPVAAVLDRAAQVRTRHTYGVRWNTLLEDAVGEPRREKS